MTAHNIIADVLRAPLPSDWTVEGLAESLLDALAAQPSDEPHSFVVDETTDHQSRRLIRPLLALLAHTSTTMTNLYGGPLHFTRTNGAGLVRVTGEFVNRAGDVRLALRSFTDSIPVDDSHLQSNLGLFAS